MLNNRKKLYFPKLVYIDTRAFDPKGLESVSISDFNTEIPSKLASIYSLDWTKKVQKIYKRIHSTNTLPHEEYQELSNYYEDLLESLRFNIEPEYMFEIRRASWTSVLEYNINTNLNSNLEKIYIDPTVSYIYEAFRLLADCAFDTSANFYYRGSEKFILPYLLLYKFWIGQTKQNMLLKVTRMDELITRSINTTGMTEEQEKSINSFLNYINSELDL